MKRAKTFFNSEKIKGIVKPTRKKALILAVVVAVVVIGSVVSIKNNKTGTTALAKDDVVTRGDIEVTITGSAAVEPYERYEIIPKVSGDITYCPYDVGDTVYKDDVLYMFDSSDSDLTVERQRISMQQSENNYKKALEESEKLQIKAENDGIISGLSVKVGEEVKTGTKIASIDNTKTMEVELPFTQAQIETISIGDIASVTSSKHMSTVYGYVVHVSNSSYAGNDGTTLYTVRIRFENPGAFYAGMQVGGSVGTNISPGSGVIENDASGEVLAETDGTISAIYYSNGDYVRAGTVIVALKSDDVTDKITDSTLSYKSAKISMEQTEKTLDDYKITSPINGTVITKNSKAGDTIDKTNSSTTMMVVADISKLKFELAIDELDVRKVKEGQEVMITCDAVPDETFTGIITNVSVEGVATNGVTTYAAQVEIPEPGSLQPSMNVDASVIVESANDVLMVPTADITTIGNRNFVFVKDKVEAEDRTQKEEKKDEMTPPEGMPEGKPEGAPEGMPEGAPEDKGAGEAPQNGKNGGKSGKNGGSMMPEAPEGYTTVEVSVGIASEDYSEILSGLSEGQEIYSQITESSSNTMSNMMGGMGAMGGGMPGGGMGGGMPGGNMGGNRGGMR